MKSFGNLRCVFHAGIAAASRLRRAGGGPVLSQPPGIVVPQAAGGGVDIMARSVAQKLTESWGQQVIVDNRPGANGIIGIEAVAKSKPDGYTLSAAFTSVLTINPHVYKSLPYDTFRDFAPISQTVTNTIVLIVHPSLPVRRSRSCDARPDAAGQPDYGRSGSAT
jgi:tripartite-type tricarboxylate transporter receptor subunit TctC